MCGAPCSLNSKNPFKFYKRNSFFISYEFKSRVLAMLMGAMFDAAFRRFSEAFERRADKVYGRVSTS